MANFDTSQMENATVKYADNGTTLVVEWANVFLQGSDGGRLEGPFTFQAILHKKGDIIFAYKSIPISISTITDDDHPVKVGLSDAYIIERTIFCKSISIKKKIVKLCLHSTPFILTRKNYLKFIISICPFDNIDAI